MQRRRWIQWGAAAALAPALAARAQSFPARPIKLVIAFPAGGPTDITMRVLAENASRVLGQPVVIDNKPGAGGTLPAQMLQSSPADGYTVAQIPLGVFRMPYTTKINWDPVKDISYVINVTGYAFGVVVPADSPFKTWADFVAYAKANPGKLSYGSTGALTSPHLTMERVAQQQGLQLLHVPYKGSAPAMVDLMGGQIPFTVDTVAAAVPQLREGKVKAIAVTSAKRSSLLPNVPTLAESGYAIDMDTWLAVVAPAGLPPAVKSRLERAVAQVVEDAETRDKLLANGFEPAYGSSKALAALIEKELPLMRAVAQRAGITAD